MATHLTPDEIAQICPNCTRGLLVPSGQVVQLRGIFDRWRAEAGVQFSSVTDLEYVDQLDEPIELHACSSCRFRIFLPPISGTPAFYRDIAAEEKSYYVENRWEFERALRRIATAGHVTVLDVGCGSGAFLAALAKLPHVRAYGYEFNPQVAAHTRNRGFRLIDALEPKEAVDGGFDFVCLFQVLEHFAEPFAMLERVGRMLRPGGRMVVCVPDAAGPVRHFVNALTDLPPHHVTRWCADAIRACAERRGYTLEDLRTEPLGDYVWNFYLPVMLERDLLPPRLARWLVAHGVVRRTLAGLTAIGIRWLWPLPGHTLYSIWRDLRRT